MLKVLKGRPRWGDIFVSLEPYREATPDDPNQPSTLTSLGATIGIFYCGTRAVGGEIALQCALRGPAFRFHGD